MKDVYILGIESSCDETAAAVVKNGREVLSNIISSQVPLHTLYGGVVPEIASRKHTEKIVPVVSEALKSAGMTLSQMDGIAVTYGPGLVGALLIGVSFAKALSFSSGKPLLAVNHIEGHIAANFLSEPELRPPFLSLVISGGHTHLVRVDDYGEFTVLGRTCDDAVGEAFDKVARAIGLGYPGGPKIEKAAKLGDENAYSFPKARVEGSVYDFSFSGLKSAVLNTLNKAEMTGTEVRKEDIAASFQKACVSVLCDRVSLALKETGAKQFVLAGGVSSNFAIREALKTLCEKKGVAFHVPEPVLCTDNAAMIAAAGFIEYEKGRFAKFSLNAVPNLKIGEKE